MNSKKKKKEKVEKYLGKNKRCREVHGENNEN